MLTIRSVLHTVSAATLTASLLAAGCSSNNGSSNPPAPAPAVNTYNPTATSVYQGTQVGTTSPTVAGSGVLTGFLSLTDISPTSALNTPDSGTAIAALQGDQPFYANQPVGSTTCQPLFDNLVVQATATTATVSSTVDMTSCLSQTTSSSGILGGILNGLFNTTSTTTTYSTATAKVYYGYTCPGGNLSSLNGKPLSQLQTTIKTTAACSSGTRITNVMITAAGYTPAQDEYGNSVTAPFTYKRIQYYGNNAMTPCQATYSDCLYVDRSISTVSSSASTEDYTKLTFIGVRDTTTGATWHDAGQISVNYDNWSGTVTYTNGAMAPSYTLNASGYSPVSGTFTAKSR